jgi:glycosyltransferase involved in cell wall biosynthesis
MLHGHRIAVVMPAYNAEKTLEWTYHEIPRDIVDLVLLVDDGSCDRTVEIARRMGIRNFIHKENRGYGANQKTCYTLALREGADIVVMLHPDYQYTPRLITAMAAMIASGEFDVVLGSRIPGFRLLGTRDFCTDYPNHLVFFTPHSLGRLLGSCGFRVEEVSHFSLEYSPYTTLQNILNFLPGIPGRLYKAMMGNEDGRRLRRSPVTWLHAISGILLAVPAIVLSLAGLAAPVGNTMRFYCKKVVK